MARDTPRRCLQQGWWISRKYLFPFGLGLAAPAAESAYERGPGGRAEGHVHLRPLLMDLLAAIHVMRSADSTRRRGQSRTLRNLPRCSALVACLVLVQFVQPGANAMGLILPLTSPYRSLSASTL